MTLYCQSFDALPEAQMALLGPGARSTHIIERDPNTDADVERYNYRWRDFEVNFYLSRQPEIATHLQGIIDYAYKRARANGFARGGAAPTSRSRRSRRSRARSPSRSNVTWMPASGRSRASTRDRSRAQPEPR